MRYTAVDRAPLCSWFARPVAIAALLVLGFAAPALAQTPASPIVIASCYTGGDALAAADVTAEHLVEGDWLGTEMVQMSLRQISLLADSDDSIHGYEFDEDRQMVVLVHARSADPMAVVDRVEAALDLAGNDLEGAKPARSPTVLIFPACRQVENAESFDALLASVEMMDWADGPDTDLIRFVAQLDVASTQVVVSLEESNAISDRLTEQLLAKYGDDVRIVIDPGHSYFLPPLSLATADVRTAQSAEAQPAAVGSTTAETGPLVAPITQGLRSEVVNGESATQAIAEATKVDEPIESSDSAAPTGLPTWLLAVGLAILVAAGSVVFLWWRRESRVSF